MFVGSADRLRPAYSPQYSPQLLPLMKILGTIIGHSLLHEGPGFPYFPPFVYWYLATGCVQCALSYVSVLDDLSEGAAMIVKQVYVNFERKEESLLVFLHDVLCMYTNLCLFSSCNLQLHLNILYLMHQNLEYSWIQAVLAVFQL